MSLSKKAQQRLHFLRRLKRASLPPPILTTFYRGTIESVLTSCITVWYGNCSAADRKTLQRTVNTAAKIIGAPLPSILDIFLARCSSKTNSIMKDPTHPSHSLFQLLPSGRWTGASEPAPPDCSTAFSPRLWEPWTQITPPPSETPCKPLPPETWTTPPPSPNTPPTLPHQKKKKKKKELFCSLCNSKCATHRWVGLYKPPVVPHSPLCALDTFHTLLCVHNPTKDSAYMYVYMLMHYKSSCTVPRQLLDLQCFSLHMYSIMWSIRIVCSLYFIFYLYLYRVNIYI